MNRSKRSPKGNRQMRRVLNQAANAAVKPKGSIFEIVYRRLVLRLGHYKTIGAIAHRPSLPSAISINRVQTTDNMAAATVVCALTTGYTYFHSDRQALLKR